MCDTLYAGSSVCTGGRSLFAKNSDRKPDEPQALMLTGRRESGVRVRVGGRDFPIADKGFAYALSKPSWMEGGEMGLNEAGVAIGNEAVFSRFPAAREGVLGMDILRAALASAGDAEEALGFICDYTESHDQGGNGSFHGSLYYCNSYLIADQVNAYVLETAGRRWAWRQIEGVGAISNAYSIETDYKRLDSATRKDISPVNEKAACSDEADAGRKGRKDSWRGYVESRLRLRFTHGDERRAASLARLRGSAKGLSAEDIFATLSLHTGRGRSRRPLVSTMRNLCMHAGGLLSQATTASMVVEYLPGDRGNAVLWFSGTSYPCLSIYKPMLLIEGHFIPLWTDYDYAENSTASFDHWQRQRAWLNRGSNGELGEDQAFRLRRDSSQAALREVVERALRTGDPEGARTDVNAAVADWYRSLPSW